MKVRPITSMNLCILGMIDSGECDHITPKDISDHVEKGDIFDFLLKLETEPHLNLLLDGSGPYPDFKDWYIERIQMLVNAVDAGRKLGIYNRGLCALVAYNEELIAMGEDIQLS